MKNLNFEIYRSFFSLISDKKQTDDYISISRGLPFNNYRHCFKTILNKTEWNFIISKLTQKYSRLHLIESGIFSFFKYAVENIPFLVTAFYEKDQITYLWARRIDSNDFPKTLNLKGINSPVFNIDTIAKLKPNEKVYICEGVFDTLSIDCLGYKAIGLLGVHAYTEKTINLLLPFEIEIAFDNDDAGNKASQELANKFWQFKKPVSRSILPDGLDVNEYYMTGGFGND